MAQYADPYNYSVFSNYAYNEGRYTWDNDMLSFVHDKPAEDGNGMWFRLMLPPSIDVNRTEKYPLVIFFHGSGETGTDNAIQLVHGGQKHITAIKTGVFPGLALYTQSPYKSWWADGSSGTVDKTVQIIEKLIEHYNVDPYRVYVHGLSMGGNGTWEALKHYAKEFACAIPMSAAQAEVSTYGDNYIHVPLWMAQGGTDTNPTPEWGNDVVNEFRAIGGSIRYEFMPTTGHGTWNNMYNKPDFFSWMLSHHKTDIHAYYEQSRFCEGESIPSNLILGVSAGFENYQWTKDDTNSTPIASGSDKNEIVVNTAGNYYVRVQRDGVWSDWSNPRQVDNGKVPSPSPVISSGTSSVTLPGLDGRQSVILGKVSGLDTYLQWYKDDVEISEAQNSNFTVLNAGDYHLTVRTPATSPYQYVDYTEDGIPDQVPAEYRAEPIGCESNPSNIITVTTSSGPSAPLPPQNLFTFTRAINEIELVWDDNSDNETGFEIYRSIDNGNTFTLLTLLPASSGTGPVRYSDHQAYPDQEFCYMLRAYNSDGGSPYSTLSCASTGIDNNNPVPPTISLASSSQSVINLYWSGATDDVGVVEYDLYRNGILIYSTDEVQYSDISVVPFNTYVYSIVAKDAAGNESVHSNQLTAYSVNDGLVYRYYETSSGLNTVDVLQNHNLISTGKSDNFDISLRNRNDYFGFIFQGYINITTGGTYRFYTRSDDGSKVYINNTLAYNNDGNHGCNYSTSPAVSFNLTPGSYPIEVRMYENSGGECLQVYWEGPGISRSLIPDNALKDNYNPPAGPTSPSNLSAVAVSYNQVNLSWQDNSNNETGFEIYRQSPSDNNFVFLSSVGPNVVAFSDMNVQPSSTYLYKVVAINNNGVSALNATAAITHLLFNNDLSDNSLNDITVIARNGTPPFNSTDFVEGSHSVEFLDNITHYLDIDTDNQFIHNTFTKRSVAMWVKVNEVIGDQIIFEEGGSSNGFAIRIYGDYLQFACVDNSVRETIQTDFTAYEGVWTHIVAIFDDGLMKLYVNKVLQDSKGTSYTNNEISSHSDGAGLGNTNSGNAFNSGGNFGGLVDNFLIYDVGLSQSEIDRAYDGDFGFALATTPAAPATPLAPTNLSAIPTSTSQINLTWTDNSSNETGFEIYRSTADIESTYLLIHTTAANVTSYSDLGLTGNNEFFYKVRAKGEVNNSDFTLMSSATTLNNPPTFDLILNRSVQIGTTLEFEISVQDLDLDEVTFDKDGIWPAYGSITSSGFNKAILSFVNPPAEAVWNLRVSATDGIDLVYSNTFTILANNNQIPQITAIPNQQMDEGEDLTVNISATDEGGDVLLSVANLPFFATFNYAGSGGTASITFSPDIRDAGVYRNIQVIADDGDGGINIESFDINVQPIVTSYQVMVNFTNSEGYQQPWNYAGGATQTAITEMWPVTNLLSSVNSSVEMELDVSPNPGFSKYWSLDLSPGVVGVGTVPDEVIRYGLVQKGTTFTLNINNLNDALSYNISLLSSVRDAYFASNMITTYYSIDGVEKFINPSNNSGNFVEFLGLTSENGTISITIRPTSSQTYTIINALTLEAYYDDGTAPDAPSGLALTAIAPDKVGLIWEDNSYNELGFRVFRRAESETNFTQVLEVGEGQEAAIDSVDLSGTTRYYYYIQAYNNNGGTVSETRSVVTLNAPPVITSVPSFIVPTGSVYTLNVSASDPEGNSVVLQMPGLPEFATFIDNGNGTGQLLLDPEEIHADKEYELTLTALDNALALSARQINFLVINSGLEQIVKINLSTSGLTEGAYWNNIISDPSVVTSFTGITDVQGNATAMQLNVSGWEGNWARGATYVPEPILPESVVRGCWYTFTSGSLTLSNLDPSKHYNVKLFSSIDDTHDFSVGYSSNGQNQVVDAYKNYNISKSLAGLVPDGSGNLTVNITNLSDSLAMLNAIIIERYDTESKPHVPGDLIAKVVSSTAVELSWIDNSGIESGFEIYRYDYETSTYSLVTTTLANVQSYTNTGLSANKKYGYRIRAISNIGNSDFTQIVDATTFEFVVYLNVNSTSEYAVGTVNGIRWNNTSADPSTGASWSNLYESLGTQTNVGLAISRWATGSATNNGALVSDGIYPQKVLESSYYMEMNDDHVLMEWLGLDTDKKYNIAFSASRRSGVGVARNGESEYIAGQGVVNFNAWDNSSKKVTIFNLGPDEINRIAFEVKAFDSPVRNAIPNYGFLGAMELQVYSDLTSAFPTAPSTYYAVNTDANDLNSWNESASGIGSVLPSFTTPAVTLEVPEGAQLNLQSNFDIDNPGTKLKLEDGVLVNFNNNNLTLNIANLELAEGAQVQLGGTGLSTATIEVGDEGVNLRNGSTLDIGGATLRVVGKGVINLNNLGGEILVNGGNIELINNSTNTHHLHFAANSNVQSFIINNTNLPDVILYDSLSIHNNLEVTNGNLYTGNYIKLISDQNSTAMIPPVGATSSITGEIEYQRYWARAQGGFYYLGSPIEGQTLQEWHDDFHIQGVQGSYPTGWTNVYSFDESTHNWSALTNLTDNVSPGNGIMVFMFSRDFTDGYVRYNNIGTPIYGDYQVSVPFTDVDNDTNADENEGWVLISNPYACAIDLDKIDWANDASGVGSAVYVFDGANNVYVTWTKVLGPFDVASGQGFFVKADGTNASPSITFKESHKSLNDATFLREATMADALQLSMSNQSGVEDKYWHLINSKATEDFDPLYDAYKNLNSGINIYGLGKNGSKMAVNNLPSIGYQDTLHLVTEGVTGSYKVTLSGLSSFADPANIYLYDKYLGTTQHIYDGYVHTMDINTNEIGSFGQRLDVIWGKPGLVSMPDLVLSTTKKELKLPVELADLSTIGDFEISIKFDNTALKLINANLKQTWPDINIDTTEVSKGIVKIKRQNSSTAIDVVSTLTFCELVFDVNNTAPKHLNINVDMLSTSFYTMAGGKFAYTAKPSLIEIKNVKFVKGEVRNRKGEPLVNVPVHISNTIDMIQKTDNLGQFSAEVWANDQYEIYIDDDNSIKPDVDIRDLVQLTRYALAKDIPANNLDYQIADINEDGNITALDVAALKQYLLNRSKDLPGSGKSLRFLPEIDNSNSNINVDPESNKVVLAAIEDASVNFISRIKGEIYSKDDDQAGRKDNQIIIGTNTQFNNGYLEVPIYLNRDIDISGIELKFGFDADVVEIKNFIIGDPAISLEAKVDMPSGSQSYLWASRNEGVYYAKGEELLRLVLDVKDPSLSNIEDILQLSSSSVLVDDQMISYQLVGLDENLSNHILVDDNNLKLYPIPAVNVLNLQVVTSESVAGEFIFIDVNGKLVGRVYRNLQEGINAITFDLKDESLNVKQGLYVLKMKIGDWQGTRTFIVND